jgi:two-component system response regulator
MILLVEDNPDDVELTRRALRKGNITSELRVVTDGAEALELLLGEPPMDPPPHVILLDLNLPRVSGLEVLARLRADDRTRRIPVVVLTSSVEEADLVRSYDLGANSYVRKPVDFAEFVEVTARLGVYWLNVNRRAPR